MKNIVVIVVLILSIALAKAQIVNVIDAKVTGGISSINLVENPQVSGDENFGNVEVGIYGRHEIITGGQRGIGAYYKGSSAYAKIGDNVVNGRQINEIGIAYKFAAPAGCSFVCGNFNVRGGLNLGGVRVFKTLTTPVYYRTESWDAANKICTVDSGYTRGVKATVAYGYRFSGAIGLIRHDPSTLPGRQRWLYSIDINADVWQMPKSTISFYNLPAKLDDGDKVGLYYDGKLTLNLVYIPLNHSAHAGICPVVAVGVRNITNYIYGNCFYAEYGLGIHSTKGTGEALSIRLFTASNQSFKTSFGGLINVSLIDLYRTFQRN